MIKELAKAEHNRETILSILKGKPNKTMFEGYEILRGSELKENKKYHILTKILNDGLFDGLGRYENWIFNTIAKDVHYKGISGITEGYKTEKIPYNFRLNYDDIFIVKEIEN